MPHEYDSMQSLALGYRGYVVFAYYDLFIIASNLCYGVRGRMRQEIEIIRTLQPPPVLVYLVGMEQLPILKYVEHHLLYLFLDEPIIPPQSILSNGE